MSPKPALVTPGSANMDALDLTTGERIAGIKFLPKGSRRKAATPQRRQHGEGDSSGNSDKNSDSGKTDNESLDGDDNQAESRSSVTPPRPPSEGSAKPEDSNQSIPASNGLPIPQVPNLSSMIGDLAKKYLQGREKLAAMTVRTMFDRGHHLLPNSNQGYRASPPLSTDTPPQESESTNSDYRHSAIQKELPMSLWNPGRGFAMDELMQQRLRRYLDDVQPAEAPGIPERTKKQNRWAFNVWREWARKRNSLEDSFIGPYKGVPLDVGQAGEEELDYWLCKFVMEIRRKDGNPYPPHTLMQIVMGIQRYLRQQAGKPTICILDRSNATYSNFRAILDYRIKELTSIGSPALKSASRTPAFGEVHSKYDNAHKGDLRNFPAAGSEEYNNWKDGILNTDTAQGLLNAVFWHNYSTFGIQYIDDHWNLRAEHFQIKGGNDTNEPMCLEFNPSVITGGTAKQNGMRVAHKKIYSDTDKDIFNAYRKYLSNIPKSGPFYRHPVDPTIVDRSIKFSDQWVGKNRLRAMLKHLIEIGNNANRLKSLKASNRRTDLSARGYVTPMMQLSSHAPDFPPAAALQENAELIKPFLNLHQMKLVGKREADRDSNEDHESTGAPSPKIPKSVVSEPKSSFESGSNSSIDDAVLEITVPKTIKSIVVMKAGKKITFELE